MKRQKLKRDIDLDWYVCPYCDWKGTEFQMGIEYSCPECLSYIDTECCDNLDEMAFV